MFLMNLLPPYSSSSTLEVEGACFSETSVSTHEIVQCHDPEDTPQFCVWDLSVTSLIKYIRVLCTSNTGEVLTQTSNIYALSAVKKNSIQYDNPTYVSPSKTTQQISLFPKHYLMHPFLDFCIWVLIVLITPETEPAVILYPSLVCRHFPGIAINAGVTS
jgi:hypothetical protein